MPFTVHLRGEPSPDDAILIVRAGERGLEVGKLRGDAERSRRTLGILGVSVAASLPGESLAAAWAGSDVLADRRIVWWTTAGAIRGAGFPLLDTGRDPRHFTVVLASTMDELLVRLAGLFSREERP